MNKTPASVPARKINWPGALFLTLSPIAAIVLTALHLYIDGFVWPVWVLAIVFYALTAGSITGGYHRYFSHRTYEARTWLKWFWALFGGAAWQNSILTWAADHRVHHRFVDTDLDPYSINRGFFWAHFGWMLVTEPPKVNMAPYSRDLAADPVVAFQHKYYIPLAITVSFGLPTLIGWFMGSALGGLAVAGFLRVVLVHHMTFFINSWCHYFGKQNYTDTNTARDSFFMAVATFGEGYHNFHHIFANDYRNGVKWYHWDPTKWVIQIFRLLGGAHSLRRTPKSEILRLQMQMEEKALKNRLQGTWHASFQTQLDNLRAKVETAQTRFEHLRVEYTAAVAEYKATAAGYKAAAANYAHHKMERVQEMKYQMRLAKIEMRAAIKQWRAFNRFAKATA